MVGGPQEGDVRALAERLRESESRFVEAQRIAHIGSWEWDIAANRVTWSDELHRIYGLPREQFGGTYEAFLARVVPEERDVARAIVGDAFRKAEPFAYDHRVVRPDGERRVLRTRGDVVTDAGKVVRMIGICWDITDHVMTTEQLASSVSLLRATLESTADGLLIVDLTGKVVAFNYRLLELWRIEGASIEGRMFEDVLDMVHPQLDNADECMRYVRLYAAHPEMEGQDTLRFKDGRVFERYSRPQHIDRVCVGRVWSYRDVSQRERLMQRSLFLSDASRLLASLDVEKALGAATRLAVNEMCASCAIDLIEEGQLRRAHVQARAPEAPTAFPSAATQQSIIYDQGGTSCIRVPLNGHGGLLGVLHFAAAAERRYDASDLSFFEELAHRVEQALENTRLFRELERALASRDEFLAIAAHELRGPLTSLRFAVQGLQRAPTAGTASQLFTVVEREEKRLARFVDELLDVARIRSGQMRFVLTPVDLVEVTRQVVTRMTADAARARSSLTLTAPTKIVGVWDSSRLEQVATNLVSNAIKFGGGGPIEVTIEEENGAARLVVSDHGIGIEPAAQARIFSAFERAVSVRNYGGLGLGLYIVQTIAEGMGGNVRVESEVGHGSRFVVTLPKKEPR
jgi:PAS domain S-box-containing protein